MKVESINSLMTVPVSSMARARVSEGSIALPVDSTHYIYANLKNIRGIPAPSNGSGYSLSRLKALDNLIERLRGLGVEREKPDFSSLEETSPGLNRVVAQMRQELKNTINRTPALLRGPQGLDAGLSLNYLI